MHMRGCHYFTQRCQRRAREKSCAYFADAKILRLLPQKMRAVPRVSRCERRASAISRGQDVTPMYILMTRAQRMPDMRARHVYATRHKR